MNCTTCGAPDGGIGDRGLGRYAGLWRSAEDGAVWSAGAGAIVTYARSEEFDSAFGRLVRYGTDAQLERYCRTTCKCVQVVDGLCQFCRRDAAPKVARKRRAAKSQGELFPSLSALSDAMRDTFCQGRDPAIMAEELRQKWPLKVST